jgi:hypothetical protein
VAWALAIETIALVLFVVSIRSRNGNLAGIALVLVAFGAWYAMRDRIAAFDGDRALSRALVAAMAVAILLMVVMPSRQSADAFLYGIYGRIVAIHHSNPWRTVPADVPHDPIERFVGGHWVHTPSYYGPVWIGWSALGAWVVPATKLSIRLLFQITSAVLAAAIGALLWRRTRSLATAALFVLQPLVLLSVVNGGHNDGLVALCSLGAVLVLLDGMTTPDTTMSTARLSVAGVIFAVAALVKATALLGAFGAVLWLFAAGRRRDAVWLGSIAGGLTAIAMALAPGSISALRGAGSETSFLSIWQTVRSALHPSLLVHGAVWGPENYGLSRAAPFVAAIAVVAAIAWLRPAIARGAIGIEWAVMIGLTSYLVFGSWVMPWHLLWALPLVALIADDRLWRVVTLQCVLVLGLFQAEDWIRADLWRGLRVLVIVAVPLGIALAYALVLRAVARDSVGNQPAPTGRPSMI